LFGELEIQTAEYLLYSRPLILCRGDKLIQLKKQATIKAAILFYSEESVLNQIALLLK